VVRTCFHDILLFSLDFLMYNCNWCLGPLHIAGHTAVVINDKGNKSRHSRMVVISGHSPRYGYVNVVQEFHFGKV